MNPIKKELQEWKQILDNLRHENLQRTLTIYKRRVRQEPLKHAGLFLMGFLMVAGVIITASYADNQLRICDVTWTLNQTNATTGT